ncbi:hypothetical protein F5Y18DRAFT_387175 [Xylariaceae sp. FL1019]|nr:hypothetical protein F5Y18DRAFT_387175 [Xylariaceae sp. FL1019]
MVSLSIACCCCCCRRIGSSSSCSRCRSSSGRSCCRSSVSSARRSIVAGRCVVVTAIATLASMMSLGIASRGSVVVGVVVGVATLAGVMTSRDLLTLVVLCPGTSCSSVLPAVVTLLLALSQ